MTKRNHMRPGTASGSRRLSDVEEGGGAGVPSVEGALDELVPLDEGPDGGPLTQFQEKGGSLLEETAGATQTQAPPAGTPPAAQANTMSLVRVLRERFAKAEELSLFAITTAMARRDAARLFYQLCVMNAGGYLQTTQAEPYADLKLRAGPAMQGA